MWNSSFHSWNVTFGRNYVACRSCRTGLQVSWSPKDDVTFTNEWLSSGIRTMWPHKRRGAYQSWESEA